MTLAVLFGRARPVKPGLPVEAGRGSDAMMLACILALSAGAVPFLARADVIADTTVKPQGTVVEPMPAPRHPRQMTYMKRKWGVEILFLRETAAGYMLEFRYKVLDPAKAAPLFARKTKPVLNHVRTGAQLVVPTPAKTGALRNSDAPLADHTYWMFFANPNRLVKSGDRVNLQIGDFAVEGLVVQ